MLYRDPLTDIKRLWKSIDPKILLVSNDYREIEKSYKELRANIAILPKVLEEIRDSIYGGKIGKVLSSALNQLTGVPKNEYDTHNTDCYYAAHTCLKNLSASYTSAEHKQACADLSNSMKEMSLLKNELNKKLKGVIERLEGLTKFQDEIDTNRYLCRNSQYNGECRREELEKKNVTTFDQDAKFSEHKKNFERFYEKSKKGMLKYNKDEQILKDLENLKEIFLKHDLNVKIHK